MHNSRQLRPNWQQARHQAYDAGSQVGPSSLPVRECLGDQLAEPLIAEAGLPHYASSAMDGWVVAGSGPWLLAEPGPGEDERLFPGQARPVRTGGLIPPGAEAVLRSESGHVGTDDEGAPRLQRSEHAAPGEPRRNQHIRHVGEEADPGSVLCEPGIRLTPAHLALAATVGRDTLRVAGHVCAKLVYTGDEVQSRGMPEPGHVRDAFGVQLAATAAMTGVTVTDERRVPDSRADLIEALEPTTNVIVTTGGTAHSSADLIRPALADLDAELLVEGIAIRPGGPALLARLPGGTFVVGLPGNPLAAFVGFALLFDPLVRALRGLDAEPEARVPCGAPIPPFTGSTKAVPFRRVWGMASPLAHVQAGMLRGFAQSSGLMMVPPHGTRLGEEVPVVRLPWQHG